MKYFLPLLGLVFLAACSNKLAPDYEWKNRQWILVEMKGVPVQLSGSSRDAHIEFQPGEKRYTGTGGCNRINGSYTIDKKNRIRFGDPSVTKIFCTDSNFEATFLQTLKTVDHYTEAGFIMLLKKGDEVVLKLQVK